MDYTRYTTEDFVLDEYFRRWVNQQLPPEDNFWVTWLSEHPEKNEEVKQARFVLEAFNMEPARLDPQRQAVLIQNILDALTEKPAAVPRRFLTSTWLRVAAMLVLLSSIGWFLYQRGNWEVDYEFVIASSKSVEKINNSDQPLTISLSDGSVITLQPRSSLRYPDVFTNDKREVYLVGEARFDVAKDAQKPFLVHSDGLVTRVLGTSFTVRAFKNDRAFSVKVFSGKVSVVAGKESGRSHDQPFNQNKGVILTTNQMVIFDREPERLTKTLVENPILIHSPTGETGGHQEFMFNNTPVTQVFETLEKSYGVTIIYNRGVLQNCTLTAPLGEETLYEKLDLVCKVIRASYEVVDAQIIITSKGCT